MRSWALLLFRGTIMPTIPWAPNRVFSDSSALLLLLSLLVSLNACQSGEPAASRGADAPVTPAVAGSPTLTTQAPSVEKFEIRWRSYSATSTVQLERGDVDYAVELQGSLLAPTGREIDQWTRQVVITQATDEKGRSLLAAAKTKPDVLAAFGQTAAPIPPSTQFTQAHGSSLAPYAPAQFPVVLQIKQLPRLPAKFTKLAGVAYVIVPNARTKVQFDLSKFKDGMVEVHPGLTVQVKVSEMKPRGRHCQVRFHNGNKGPSFSESQTFAPPAVRSFKLVDEQGSAVAPDMVTKSMQGSIAEMTGMYNTATANFTSVILELQLSHDTVAVPFELNDLPLP
jgi:hypothetical protein